MRTSPRRAFVSSDNGVERAETMAIGAQHVGEQVRVAQVGLALSCRVARPGRLHHVRMDWHHGEPTFHQRVDEEAGRPLDCDAQLLWRPSSRQATRQVRHPVGGVRDGESLCDCSGLVENTHGVLARSPGETHEVTHRASSARGTSTAARGACRTLIDRRSTTSPSGRNILWSVKARPPGPFEAAGLTGADASASEQGRPRRGAGGTSSLLLTLSETSQRSIRRASFSTPTPPRL